MANDRIRKRALLACAIAAFALSSACDKKSSAGGKPKAEEIIAVETATVQPATETNMISAIGTIRHAQETPVGFTAAGRVSVMRYDAGDYVRAGALIASLATENVQVSSPQSYGGAADADYNQFAKVEALFRDGWATKKQFETAKAKADAARSRAQAPASVTSVKRGTVSLYAPASGIVLARLAEAGQLVGPGTPALILGQDNLGFIFRAPVAGIDAIKLKSGMRAVITIETVSAPIETVVSKVEGTAATENSPIMVQFRVAPQKGVKSGQIGTVSISASAAGQGFLQIPVSALLGQQDKNAKVFIITPANRRAETRAVIIEKLVGGYAIVTGGIAAGDMIVTGGKEALKNGTLVSNTQRIEAN